MVRRGHCAIGGERILLLVACACATLGCDGGGRADTARGTLELSLDESQASREAIDAHVATAVEQVLSRSIAERAVRRLGVRADGPLGPALGAQGLTLAAPGTSAPPPPQTRARLRPRGHTRAQWS